MMCSAKIKKISIVALMIFLIVLWATGMIPKTIGAVSAKAYVDAHHQSLNLTFDSMEYSSAHGSYFAYFTYPNGERIAFEMNGGRYFPFGVFKDLLNNPS